MARVQIEVGCIKKEERVALAPNDSLDDKALLALDIRKRDDFELLD